MKRFIQTILLAFGIAASLPVITQADPYVAKTLPAKVAYEVLADQISTQYAVPAATVKKIINCESSWKPEAHHKDSKEDSYGLVQINLLAHKTITPDEATDPTFAITYLAQNLKEGNGHNMWVTCSK